MWAGAGNDSVCSTARVPTEVNGQAGNDILQGGFVDDIVRGGDGENRLYGKAGNDTLAGGPEIDRIFGANGDDSIFGNGGNDYLEGHGGNDTISGGTGNDNIQAGAGNDTIYGGTGNDNIAGHAGNDVMYGNEGNDSINGGSGNDLVAGQAGNDTLNGSSGNDNINGSFGDDLLLGFGGNDTLDGGEGLDTLYGGNGEDFLEGGFDTVADRLNGGAQNDTFVQRGGDILEDASNGNGLDSVLDYSVDNDDNDSEDEDDFANLGILLGLRGPFMTGSVSSVAFGAASEGVSNVTTMVNGTVVTVGDRSFAFTTLASENTSGGFVTVAPEVRLAATFPAALGAETAQALIPRSNAGEVLHVVFEDEGLGPIAAVAAEAVGRIVINDTGEFNTSFDLLGSSLEKLPQGGLIATFVNDSSQNISAFFQFADALTENGREGFYDRVAKLFIADQGQLADVLADRVVEELRDTASPLAISLAGSFGTQDELVDFAVAVGTEVAKSIKANQNTNVL